MRRGGIGRGSPSPEGINDRLRVALYRDAGGGVLREVEGSRSFERKNQSKGRNDRKDEGKNEPPTSVGEDSILPFCEILKLPCPRRGRRL